MISQLNRRVDEKPLILIDFNNIIMHEDQLHFKLYNRETILKWDLPEEIYQELNVNDFDYFFLSTSKEAKHKGPKHTHFSIFPTNKECLTLIELTCNSVDPNLMYKILKIIKEFNFELITSSGELVDGKYLLQIFFTKSLSMNTENLKIKLEGVSEIINIDLFDYSCNGLCED
jgi:hypothetical protein